jgi:hemoglobin
MIHSVKQTLFAVLLLIMMTSCANAPKSASLYDDLGGDAGIKKLVDKLIEKYRADTRINGLFNQTNFEYFAERLREDICVRAGGPCEYQGLSMADAHSGMDIKESEFNYFVEDSQKAMDEIGLPVGVQNRLLKLLARDRDEVIRQ